MEYCLRIIAAFQETLFFLFCFLFLCLFLSTNLSSCMGEGSCSKSKKLLPHSKPHLAHQHQTREEGMADLNVVISTFRKN